MWEAAGWSQYIFWQETYPKVVLRINELVKDMLRHPFEGIGKPEPLRNQLKGYWSRRITHEHRLVYKVEGPAGKRVLIIVQCRSHY
jgi:toxin YoeB